MLARLLLRKAITPLLGFALFGAFFLFVTPGAPKETVFEWIGFAVYTAITALLLWHGLFASGSFGHIVWSEISDRLRERLLRREIEKLRD